MINVGFTAHFLLIRGRWASECSAPMTGAGLEVLVYLKAEVGSRNEVKILSWRTGEVWCCGQQREEAVCGLKALVESHGNRADGGARVRPRSEASRQSFSREWVVMTGCEGQGHLFQRAAQDIPGVKPVRCHPSS